MNVLVLDDEEEKLRAKVTAIRYAYGDVTCHGELVSPEMGWNNIANSIIAVFPSLDKIDFVISDVYMPTPEASTNLFRQMRNGGMLAPIILVSTAYSDPRIPTKILGRNAESKIGLYRREKIPNQNELNGLEAFRTKHEFEAIVGGTGGPLRSKILTPFILQHLALQVAEQNRQSALDALSPEEIRCCTGGIDILLENDGRCQIEVDLCEVMGGRYPRSGETIPEPLADLRGWLSTNKQCIVILLKGAVENKRFERLRGSQLDDVLTAIEELSEIVNRAVDYGERLKKNSSMRHFLKNAIPRLTNYFAGLNTETRGSLDLEMKDIESSFRAFLAPSPGYSLDAKTHKTSEATHKAVIAFRAKLDKKGNDHNLLEELKRLVDQFEVMEKLTLNSPEANLS